MRQMKFNQMMKSIRFLSAIFVLNIAFASEDILYLKTSDLVWQSSDQAQAWELSDSDFNDWSNEVVVSDQQTKQIEMYFSGKGVSLEQFFLDLHNGNIIKNFGKWFLDLIAIFLLLLSISGIWIWLKKRRY